MHSLAFGIGTRNQHNDWLEVYFPRPLFRPGQAIVDEVASVLPYKGGNVDIELDDGLLKTLNQTISDKDQCRLLAQMAGSSRPCVATILETDSELRTTPEAYLKLHLLSHRFVLPNVQNLDGIYSLLPNVAWTDRGAVALEEIEALQLKARTAGTILEVAAVDKFPKMTNYVVPPGVRIAHSARVRLGAYVGDGTTVMHEGFMNFNTAAMGPNMIEGRISQGVTVGAGTDLGGSASTAGTLSGGGETVITIGRNCLISANAGTGIPLGDNCTIEAGLYVTPGTLVTVMGSDGDKLKPVKARKLAGQSELLFIRNSRNGVVECRTNRRAVELNRILHDHN